MLILPSTHLKFHSHLLDSFFHRASEEVFFFDLSLVVKNLCALVPKDLDTLHFKVYHSMYDDSILPLEAIRKSSSRVMLTLKHSHLDQSHILSLHISKLITIDQYFMALRVLSKSAAHSKHLIKILPIIHLIKFDI